VDPDQDLAIVRILAPGKYPAIKYGDPREREVGETVIAIGNPLGYTGTVTVGIISAMGRDIAGPSGAVLPRLIQTDAGINPGNSGGPLLDIDGELVGIVFAVRSGAQNIAFAIPADRVRAYVKKCLRD
jgi:serine protease Do